MPVQHQGTTPAYIEAGRVLDVDITNYTLSITTKYTKKPQTGVTWSSPYMHFVNGEGVYIMPEVGSVCWVCFPSDGDRPFVLGWAPFMDEGDYRSRRQDLNPGDIYLGTRDENFLVLRRGGVVQIGGGPLSQRIFLPINNTIKDFCENYGLYTLGGDLEWTIQRKEDTTDGTRPALLKLSARAIASDAKPIAFLQVGSHGDQDPTILSLLINASGEEGAAKKVSLALGKDGTVKWDVESDVSWVTNGKFTVTAKQDLTLSSSSSKVEISAGSVVNVKGQTGVTIEASSGMVKITGAPIIKMGQKVLVGESPMPVALATPLVTWLTSHVHTIPGPTSPLSGPPAVPPLELSIAASSLNASLV